MNQPQLSDYYYHISNYDQYLSILALAGILGAWAVVRFVPARGLKLPAVLTLPAIMALALVLRVPMLFQSAWYDETFTSAVTRLNISDMMTVIAGDVHPPLYYFIVKLFTVLFGHNEIAMRMPALFSSLALVVVMYWIASEHGKRIARWSAFITAVMPMAVYYGSEARYPAFMALMLGISYLGIRKQRGWMFSVPLIVASLSHVNAYFYVLVMVTMWLMMGGNRKHALLSIAGVVAWLPMAMVQAGDVADGFWLPQSLPFLHVLEMSVGSRFDTANMAIIPLVVTVLIFSVSIWRWRKQASWLWLGVAVAVPFGQWLAGEIWHPVYLPRTLLFSALLLVIPVAWWLDRASPRWLAGVAGLVVVFALVNMLALDRASYSDDAVLACGDAPIYATNIKTGIYAKHHSASPVILYERGASTAQHLPPSAQRVLFDDVSITPPADACIVAEISPFNTPAEMMHISYLMLSRDVIRFQEMDLNYYLVMTHEDN